MLVCDVVRAAIPDADASLIDFILWGRTPYPVGKVDARMIYQAADRLKRAGANQRLLCDFCDREISRGAAICQCCRDILDMADKTSRSGDLDGKPVSERRLRLK